MLIQAVTLGRLVQKPIKLSSHHCYSEKCLRLTKEEFEYLLTLYTQTEKEPKKVLNALIDFLKRHPTLPEALSLMSYNHIQRRKIPRANEFIEHNYKHNSDHLLAKINYADLCLRRNHFRDIEEIFEGKTDLIDICPEREVFHFEEYRSFHVTLSDYYLAIRDPELAEGHLLLASNVDPKHPSILSLARKVYKETKSNPLYTILGNWKRTFSSV